jgi:hypothetical protein
MIKFQITDNKGGQPQILEFEESLTEVTLRRFIDFKEKVEVLKPENLAKFESLNEQERFQLLADISLEEIETKWNDYTIEFVKFWAGISDHVIARMSYEDVFHIYSIINNLFSKIQISENEEFFEFQKERYYYPQSPPNAYSGSKDYLKSNRMVDVIEAMQFELFSSAIGETKWSVLPNIIAILCKKKDEELPIKTAEREQWIAKRAKLFEQLPVNVALNAAFFLLKRKRVSESALSKYSTLPPVEAFRIPERPSFGKSMDGTPQPSKWLSQDSLILAT